MWSQNSSLRLARKCSEAKRQFTSQPAQTYVWLGAGARLARGSLTSPHQSRVVTQRLSTPDSGNSLGLSSSPLLACTLRLCINLKPPLWSDILLGLCQMLTAAFPATDTHQWLSLCHSSSSPLAHPSSPRPDMRIQSQGIKASDATGHTQGLGLGIISLLCKGQAFSPHEPGGTGSRGAA